jgi:hypothetical protein
MYHIYRSSISWSCSSNILHTLLLIFILANVYLTNEFMFSVYVSEFIVVAFHSGVSEITDVTSNVTLVK